MANVLTGEKGFASVPLEERFWEKVSLPIRESDGADACWPWLGYRTDRGYGYIWVDGGLRPAHRVSYEMFYGDIPEGLVIDHLCRFTSCVKPMHLEVVTQAENVLRGKRSQRIASRALSKVEGE